MKRFAIFSSLIVLPLLVFSTARTPPLPQEEIVVFKDGVAISGVKATMIEDVPCLGLDEVREIFKTKVHWKRVSRQVQLSLENGDALYTLDSSTAVLSGKEVLLEVPIRWWTGRPFFPLSHVASTEFSSLCGAVIRWRVEGASKTLSIDTIPPISSPTVISDLDKTRIIIDLGPHISHKITQRKGQTLRISFYGGHNRTEESIELTSACVQRIDLRPGKKTADLILTLNESAAEPVLTRTLNPSTLVVEVKKKSLDDMIEAKLTPPAQTTGHKKQQKQKNQKIKKPLISPTATPLPSPPATLTTAEDTPQTGGAESPRATSPLMALSPIKTIVIDPGHGGRDSGAIGPRGTLEKDLNLTISRALAEALERENRFRVIMTRYDDIYLPLEDRTTMANKVKADLFISIHCNAAFSRVSNGFEVYFLSEKATDDAAAATARRENAVVELEGITGRPKQVLQEMMWSLAKTETLNDSSEISALILRHAKENLSIISRGVRQAGFYVFKGANMPSVLVESGFITNPEEEAVLRSRRFQRKLAESIVAGIVDYEVRKIKNGKSAKSMTLKGEKG